MIADNIREARLRAGHTQESLAALIDVAPGTISRWERGDKVPEVENILALAKALGTTTDNLLGHRTETPKRPLAERVAEHLERGDKVSAIREIVTDVR